MVFTIFKRLFLTPGHKSSLQYPRMFESFALSVHILSFSAGNFRALNAVRPSFSFDFFPLQAAAGLLGTKELHKGTVHGLSAQSLSFPVCSDPAL